MFTVQCTKACDQGMAAEYAADEFAIKRDGEVLFIVYFGYADDHNRSDNIRVSRLTELRPEQLPSVYGGIHLAGLLYDFLMTKLEEEGAEFFGDLFWNSDGNSIELPFDTMVA